jgi:osmotically-inducible protein OsmY
MKTDAEIKKDIMDELKRSFILSSSCIRVDVRDGIVWLTGKIDSYRKKYEAAKAISNIADIKKFHLDLNVEVPSNIKTTDANIKDGNIKIFSFFTS